MFFFKKNELKKYYLNYKLKHIIPAVASTNACIANLCATEAFKLATSCSQYLNNYIVFNQSEGKITIK